jgi:hypothetical protein
MLRHEIKYLLNQGDARIIKDRLKKVCEFDANSDENGMYKVCSLYFDDFCNSAVNDNMTGQLKRKKFRIRTYNHDGSTIRLERKSKNNEGGCKDSVLLTREQYDLILKGGIVSSDGTMNEVLNDFINCLKTRLLKPRVAVEYDRVAYIYEPGDVRITFDSNIRSSVGNLDILSADKITTPVTKLSDTVMEVKYTGFLPEHIKSIINFGRGYRQAFSKYIACRSYIS